jgi:hypothetical protein
MFSFISALAFFILVLSNGCFTLPILNEQISSSTYSSINDDVTTKEIVNLRLVTDNETSVLPNIDSKRSTDEHMGYEVSTSSINLSGNKFVKALRAFDEYSTSEPMIITTEESNPDKREYDDLPFTINELMAEADEVDRRSVFNEFENDTQKIQIETTTTNNMLSFTSTSVVPELLTTESSSSPVASTVYTTESSSSPIASTVYTTESSSSLPVASKVYTTESSTSTSSSSTVVPKVYTTEASTSTLSSSTVVPKVSKPESSTSSSTSTEKYIGLLKDEEEYEYKQSTKPIKIQRKLGVSSIRKSKVNVEDKSEDPKESTVPTAVFDQQALDKVPNIPNDFLMLDETNDLVVTGLPNRIFTTTKAYKKEEEAKPLNQGEESSHSEEKESNH